MKASLLNQHERTFPRKRFFTKILYIHLNFLIYNNKLWDGWPPNVEAIAKGVGFPKS